MRFVFDPYLFSFSEDMTPEQTSRYVGQFVELKCWWEAHQKDIYMPQGSNDMLWEGGFFPLAEKLKPLLDECDEAIDYKDVSRTMNLYLGKSCVLEQQGEDVLMERLSCSLDKESRRLIKDRPEVFRESIVDIIWNIMRICTAGDKAKTDEFAVFSRGIDRCVEADFVYECLDKDNEDLQLRKKRKCVGANCHSSVSAFLHHKDTPCLMLQYQEGKDDLYLGIRCKVLQDSGLEDLGELDGRYSISLQDSFYDDFCHNGYSDRLPDIRSALDSISKAVRGVRHGGEHNMRKGKGGNDPYIFHGDYAAMRKNVTTSIKLHFWKRPPHYIFAKIGEHDFFDVPWEFRV